MSFLDSLKETAKNLGDKAADTAEIAKIKMKISSAEHYRIEYRSVTVCRHDHVITHGYRSADRSKNPACRAVH